MTIKERIEQLERRLAYVEDKLDKPTNKSFLHVVDLINIIEGQIQVLKWIQSNFFYMEIEEVKKLSRDYLEYKPTKDND
jgi:hypothetical protein